ncbi:uncharacterized protein BCR38DRAFT_422528 [Pseudomassariella vexata]|uniref:Uncharacterized protein n=1 Tax=Pseudomassariella vexata TaxID=1141098 RepID=A0A1Y2E9I8_9PEZI|nr:uncharacterized protein BCR38DRAFT_422528 [Pseudomassariella vexata]ORY68240.1 hypothetical protein BCR38DRAFT_422528 [Pseudomassariella vexata]
MTSTATSASATSTVANCGANLYDPPVSDAVCAMPYGGNHTDIMSSCCGSADVVSYYNNCGLYCLAVGQSIADLTDCLFDNGASWQDVFCNSNTTATATGTSAAIATSAGASVVAGGGASGTSSENGASSTGEGSSESLKGAAPGGKHDFSITTLGLTIGALLFSATAFGAFQL